MKKNNLILTMFLSFTAVMLFSSNSGGIFSADHTGNSGMPNGGVSCGNGYCHGGMTAADNTRLQVKVLDANGQDAIAYVPANTYTVQISLQVNNSTKAGFQSVACLFGGAGGAGASTNSIMPNATQQTMVNNTNYISHTAAGATSQIANGKASWQYKWVAPATNVGAISIATACNVTNNNNASTGDSAFNTIKILQAPSAIIDVAFSNSISLYPSPASNYICIAHANLQSQTIVITNMLGVVVKTIANHHFAENNKIDISNLPNGIYATIIKAQGKNAVKYFTKN